MLDKYGYNAIARHVFTGIIAGVLLFAGAGTTDWPEGWAFVAVYLGGWLVLSVILARVNPELLNERGQRSARSGTKRWDYILLTVYVVLLLGQPYIAGLDHRYGWSGPLPPVVYIAGIAALVAAFALLTASMAVNRFFEATIRIQTDRGQTVTTDGPYEYIRHPGYAAVILTFLGTGLATGSWAALVIGLAGGGVFVVRTALEDHTLHAELPGYAAYAEKTRFRLLPGVW